MKQDRLKFGIRGINIKIVGDTIDGYPVYMKENVERVYIRGAETAWDLELNKSWTVSGSMTYTYGQNITRNEPARRIPPFFGRLAVEYRLKDWSVNLEWQSAAKQDRLAVGDKDDNRIPAGGTPGWNIFNVNTSYTMRFIKFDLSLLNLLNKDYRYHGSGVNGYGRSAFLSVIVNIYISYIITESYPDLQIIEYHTWNNFLGLYSVF